MEKAPIVLRYIYFNVSVPARHADEFTRAFEKGFFVEEKKDPDKNEPGIRHFEIPVVPVDEEERFISLLRDFCEKRGLIFQEES